MNHLFCLRRLRWQDMTPVNEWIVKHKMVDRLAITAHALYKISGRTVTPEEAVKVLTSIPRGALETVYKFYKGNLDPHRMFTTTTLWKAPEATEFRQRLDEEEGETDKVMDEVEEMLVQKFGYKAVEEEKELARQMVKGTGYRGAMRKEKSKEDEYLGHIQRELDAEREN